MLPFKKHPDNSWIAFDLLYIQPSFQCAPCNVCRQLTITKKDEKVKISRPGLKIPNNFGPRLENGFNCPKFLLFPAIPGLSYFLLYEIIQDLLENHEKDEDKDQNGDELVQFMGYGQRGVAEKMPE